MLRRKLFIKKIRNIFILFMTIGIMFGIYRNVKNCRFNEHALSKRVGNNHRAFLFSSVGNWKKIKKERRKKRGNLTKS